MPWYSSLSLPLLFLENLCLKKFMHLRYYSYIHCYLNYTNMAFASTHNTNLHKIHLKQKHATQLICNENKSTHTKATQAIPAGTECFSKIPFKNSLYSCMVSKLVVIYQIVLQINLPILPIDTQQIFQKTTSRYLNIYVINQNIRYLLQVLYFGTSSCQTLRKNFKNLLY